MLSLVFHWCPVWGEQTFAQFSTGKAHYESPSVEGSCSDADTDNYCRGKETLPSSRVKTGKLVFIS